MVLVVKIPPASAGDTKDTSSIPGSGRSPGEYSCLEKFREQRSLVGCSSWGCKELDVTGQYSTYTGETYNMLNNGTSSLKLNKF